ncbi:antitoxin [Azospirillum sp. B4]|uniref:antitoxin n=1 Tax=Azospirillum sp. B4 TaxID=95605 RepID=UPI0006796276|nr:hypothetical protein [Azospirillum sp. B4]
MSEPVEPSDAHIREPRDDQGPRVPGLWRGKVAIGPDFDAPLPEWPISAEGTEIREYRVKLLKQGDDQVILIPPEFEFPCEDVVLRKEGDRLILEPKPSPTPEETEF